MTSSSTVVAFRSLSKVRLKTAILNSLSNVLFLTSDNEFSGIIYSLFRGKQNIFLIIFSTKFVVKCATKILKIG